MEEMYSEISDGVVIFDDGVRGRIEVANSELDDLIIVRSNGTATYNLTVVVGTLQQCRDHD